MKRNLWQQQSQAWDCWLRRCVLTSLAPGLLAATLVIQILQKRLNNQVE